MRANRETSTPVLISSSQARRVWLRAQKLDVAEPFGRGPSATKAAIEHLGYVQIDTIHVIERCHHHILFSRIPQYQRGDLRAAQSVEKSVFEYWTHALSYVPTQDFRFFMRRMSQTSRHPGLWYQSIRPEDLRKVMRRIQAEGPISIRDIEDDVLVEKEHEWASRKPSKKALQLGFYSGKLAISERLGMLKKYELTERHFGWEKRPAPATEKEINEYVLNRALRSQGIVSLDSICHLDAQRKPKIRQLIEARVKKGDLVAVRIAGTERLEQWASPASFGAIPENDALHLLSPFDPLVIQRKRLKQFFGYDHLFEAYVPPAKRKLGYFALPVLIGEEIVAAIDLKTDREKKKLLIQKWTWIGKHSSLSVKRAIEEALARFETFQLGE